MGGGTGIKYSFNNCSFSRFFYSFPSPELEGAGLGAAAAPLGRAGVNFQARRNSGLVLPGFVTPAGILGHTNPWEPQIPPGTGPGSELGGIFGFGMLSLEISPQRGLRMGNWEVLNDEKRALGVMLVFEWKNLIFQGLFPPSPSPGRETEVNKKRLLLRALISSTSHLAMCFLPTPWDTNPPFPARKTPNSPQNPAQGSKTCQGMNPNPKAPAGAPQQSWGLHGIKTDFQQQKPLSGRRGRAGNRPSPALGLTEKAEGEEKSRKS